MRLEAQIHGGGHERGMRSGTLATHQIVGMGEAFRIAKLEMENDIEIEKLIEIEKGIEIELEIDIDIHR